MEDTGKIQILTAVTAATKISVPTELDTGWAPEPVWNFGKEKNILPLRYEPRTV